MSEARTPRVPSYRRHKPSGQAVVTLDGKDHYLGKWKSAGSRRRYEQLVSEYLANGRSLLTEARPDITVVELIAAYIRFAKTYYTRDNRPTKEVEAIEHSLRPLKRLYGRHPAPEFGPLRLKTVQQAMIDLGWARKTVNERVGRIKRMFKWAVENELLPADVFHGLQAVSGLRRGRSEARETAPVMPVPDESIEAVLPHVSTVVAAMIRLQLLTGMRSGEMVIMRGCDLDTQGRIWVYSPSRHKTEHHGLERRIFLGPKAQEIVRPYLKAELSAFLFSPCEAESQRLTQRHRQRRTPLSCGNRPGTNRKRKTKRKAGEHYTTHSYRRAITRACETAFPPSNDLSDDEKMIWHKEHHWHPHQLRHNAATRLRKEYGIEAARVVLGHRSAAITDLYAEIDTAKAEEIMAKVG